MRDGGKDHVQEERWLYFWAFGPCTQHSSPVAPTEPHQHVTGGVRNDPAQLALWSCLATVHLPTLRQEAAVHYLKWNCVAANCKLPGMPTSNRFLKRHIPRGSPSKRQIAATVRYGGNSHLVDRKDFNSLLSAEGLKESNCDPEWRQHFW